MVRIAAATTVVVALVIAIVAAGAQGAAAGGAQVLLVPAHGTAVTTLARSDARVIARYGAFTLVEASGNAARDLLAAGADRRDDMRRVTIGNRTLDPTTQRAALGARTAADGPGLAIVQFVGPIKDAWLKRLRATGARVVTYMAQNAYLVHGSAAQLTSVSSLRSNGAVRAVVPYTVADKLRGGVTAEGRQRVAIQSLSGDDGTAARSASSRAAVRRVQATSAVGPLRTQHLELDGDQVAALAADAGVVAIEPLALNTLHDERQAQIVAGNVGGDPLAPIGPGYFAFHEGLGLGAAPFGFTVDVTDSGLDEGTTSPVHPDLSGRVAYADNFTTDGDARDCDGHGTIDAGIVAGSNTGLSADEEDAEGFNHGLGVAPRVQVGASKIFNCSGDFDLTSSHTDVAASAYAKGARISSNSWGCSAAGSCIGLYNSDSQEFDALVRDADPSLDGNQELVEVFSAGNSGPTADSIGTPGNAKNVITVGASESVRETGTDPCVPDDSGADDADDLAPFSSRGPAPADRRKPDVVAPGTHILGPAPQHGAYDGSGVCKQFFPLGQTLYSESSGTSQAAPAVAGMAALVREWYRRNPGAGAATPSPAMTKAILANSATDLVGGDDGDGGTNGNIPNDSQGWGLPNLQRALSTAPRYFRDQDDLLGATGETRAFVLAVQDAAQPVRVTLAYTDAYGPTGTDPRVNDLDLTVASSAGTFKGNVFADGQSVHGGAADDTNTLESVYLPVGTTGNVTITVTGTNIAGDGVPSNADATDQDFALVASNAAVISAPPATTPVGQTPGAQIPASTPVATAPEGSNAVLRARTQNVVSSTDPKRDRTAPYVFNTKGRIVLPPYCPFGAQAPKLAGGRCIPRDCPAGATSAAECHAPSRAALCTGVVTIRFKRSKGVYTISTRSVGVKRDCTFRSRVAFKTPNPLRRGALRVYTRFQGNPFLLPRDTARPTAVHAGKR